jgi:hypothetical protein
MSIFDLQKMEKKATLVIPFDTTQEVLLNSLARAHGYQERIRQSLTGGGYEQVDNPQSKEDFIVERYKGRIVADFKRGFGELAADQARAKAESELKDI